MVKSVMFLSTLYCCNLALPLHYHKGIVQTCFVSCYIKSFEYFYIFFQNIVSFILSSFSKNWTLCAAAPRPSNSMVAPTGYHTRFFNIFILITNFLLFWQPQIKPFIVVEPPCLLYNIFPNLFSIQISLCARCS